MERSIKYYKEVIRISEKIQEDGICADAMNELAGVYTHLHDYDSALVYSRQSLEINRREKKSSLETNYLVLGDIYRHLNIPDSAYYYLELALSSSNQLTVCSTYQALFYLSQENKDYEKMAHYGNELFVYQDSLYVFNKSKELIEMQAKYDQQKIINDKKQLQIEKDREIRNILIVLVIVLCLSALLVYFYQRKVILKERIIQQNEEKLRKNVLKCRRMKLLLSGTMSG